MKGKSFLGKENLNYRNGKGGRAPKKAGKDKGMENDIGAQRGFWQKPWENPQR